MDKIGTATVSVDGDGQIVHLPEGFRLPGHDLRVMRVGEVLMWQPVTFDVDAWRAELDAYRDVPLMDEGPGMPPSRSRRDAAPRIS